ncbi:MAG: hypothetical protein FGM43_05630 [Sinobacteraceae bacterium]|nr:hypothetical protein [Nevskiaceae bacterium]
MARRAADTRWRVAFHLRGDHVQRHASRHAGQRPRSSSHHGSEVARERAHATHAGFRKSHRRNARGRSASRYAHHDQGEGRTPTNPLHSEV